MKRVSVSFYSIRTNALHSPQWLVLLLINILFFIISAWLLPIRYEENDDAFMCMIANGVYGGQPDVHLVFINAIIGCGLAFLYNISHDIEWYSLFLSLVHVLSFTVVAYKVVKSNQLNNILKAICISALYLFWLRIIAAFQFTTTAGIATFAGCLLLLHSSKRDYFGAFALILVSAMIRFEVAGLILLLFSPLFIKKIMGNRKHIITFSVLALLVFALPFIDNTFYSSPLWKQYKEYNIYRGKINDNPNYFRAEQCLPENVTYKDYHMFLWSKGDGKVFTPQKVKSIYNTLHHPSFVVRLKHLKNIVVSKKHFVPFILIILLVLLNIIPAKSSYLWYILSMLGLFIGLFILISSNAYLKDRVFLCMLLPMVYAILFSLSLNNGNLIPKIITGIMITVLVGYYTTSAIVHNKFCHLSKELVAEKCVLLQSTNAYVYDFDCHIAMQNIWHIKDIPIHPVALGWLTYIPLSKDVLLGYDDFVNHDIVVFVPLDDLASLKEIQGYLLEKYHISAEYEIINSTKRYALYKFSKNP